MDDGNAFSIRSSTTPSSSHQKKASSLQDLDVQQKSKTGMTNLRFEASTNYATKPIKNCCRTTEALTEFFFRDEHRDMLLAGKTSHNRVQRVSMPDIQLYRLWTIEAAAAANSKLQPPSVGDPILRVTTTAIRFPGLTLRTIATVGCKNIVVHDNNTTPELQITLICDELEADGPEPLVWVFNKLTGSGSGNKDAATRGQFNPFSFFGASNGGTGGERRTHSTNVIRAETSQSTTNNDHPEEVIVFRSTVRLSIDVSFPSLLLKILPVSKRMAEQQGSEAIRNVVERDIGPSLEALRQRYIMEYCGVDGGDNNKTD